MKGDEDDEGERRQEGSKAAKVNGLKLYYEIHGSGEPLVVLHGGLMTIGMMEPLVTALTESRQVIAVELEEHGYTPLRGEPLSFEWI